MDYRTFNPPADLQDLVRSYWALESPAAGSAPHRLLAESCPNIVVIRHGAFTEADGSAAARVHVAGALSKATDNIGHGPFALFGIYLWPWAVPVLFGVPPAEVQDRFIALKELVTFDDHVLGSEDIPHLTEQANTLLRSLRTASKRDLLLEVVVRTMILESGRAPLDEAATSCGLARRQFERRFKQCTGFSPALFQRILRFQRTFNLLERGDVRNLTDLALDAGYFDQSHFIRDFKRFSGLEPKAYFQKVFSKVDNFVRLP